MNIAVVILNWNGKKLLERFLPGVIAHSDDQQIYVIDNGSEDDSVVFVREQFPSVKIIQLDQNYGYAGGYNKGLQEIEEAVYVLLNSDVEVPENWLKPLEETLLKTEDCVALQPKILNLNTPKQFDYAGAAGGYIDRLGYPYCRGRIFDHIEEDRGQYDDRQQIFWASGACLVVRRQAFWEVGGLDADFFAHQEEIDLCWRLQTAGGRIMFIPESVVYHLGGGTLDSTSPNKTYLNFRNSLLLLFKNVKGKQVYLLILCRLILDALAVLRFMLQLKPDHAVAVVRAHFGFYRLVSSFRAKRKQWASHLKYFRNRSVVWNYFLLKRRTFNRL